MAYTKERLTIFISHFVNGSRNAISREPSGRTYAQVIMGHPQYVTTTLKGLKEKRKREFFGSLRERRKIHEGSGSKTVP